MPSSNKTPFLNLHQWEKSDKFSMNDFNTDNTLIDSGCKKISDNLETHINNKEIHLTPDSSELIKNHINNKKIHIEELKLDLLEKNLNNHISDFSNHITSQSFEKIKNAVEEHNKDKTLHIFPIKLEKIKSSLSSHSQDKNIHVDPVEFSNIKSHLKDSKAHVDPVTISQLKSHTENTKIHLNEITLNKFIEHLNNDSIHINRSELSNPFYFVGSYIGNGNSQQLIKLPFSPSFVIVFAKNFAPVSLATQTNESIITSAFCSKDAASLGLVPSPEGFIAQTTKTFQPNKIAKHLNTSGINYHYIAFR